MNFSIPRKLLLILPVTIAMLANAHADRETVPLLSDWRFIKDDAGIYADSDSWEQITVPHTWNAIDGQDGPAEISDKQESAAEAVTAMASKLAAQKTARE
jgi:beta-galactosidase